MQGVNVTKQVRIFMTPDQWFLYDMPGNGVAADEINRIIVKTFNRGDSIDEVRGAALAVMRANENFGATDSEPMLTLENLLEYLYR